ncbi:MAG: recombinase family protein [Lachnospiraceae bacterium]|nr:recombinase family protein [Lachnospiraceae bacterium]
MGAKLNCIKDGCYIDLGKTGTNFEREGFGRLMRDIRQHKINCVIVKDFSRFGRNYIETGNYMEKIFPFFNVRFISVSEDYDSHRMQGENDILAVNLKNVVNELYARDCARKVREVKKSKLKQGCFVGGIPSYGYYAKWIDGKKVLFPEEGTSDVVRKIYELFDGGNSIGKIITYLYEKHIHRPKEYQSTRHVYCEEGEILKQWSDQTVRTILTNHVYIGTLVQITSDGKGYRSRGRCDIEQDEVIMVEHTHEPIVGEDLFYRTSSRIEEKRKKGLTEDSRQEDIYKNLIYCGECGKKLKRICTSNPKSYGVSVRTYSYGCPDTRRIDSLKCDNHFVSLNTINKIVLETLKKEFGLSGIRIKTLVDFNRKQEELKEMQFEKKIRETKSFIQEADIEMSALYLQYRAGRFGREKFLNLKENKELEKSNLIKELSMQEADMHCMKQEADEMNHFIRCLWKGKENAVLDGQVVQCLVKRIIVYKDKRVKIIFNFRKEQFDKN